MITLPILTLEPQQREGFGWIPAPSEVLPHSIHFNEWFQNSNPVELELGCGKGKFLIARACNQPNINFIGIDWSRKWLSVGAERSQKQGMKNIQWIWGRVAELLRRIPKSSLSVIHIYFPDPWPKRKHGERRLVRAELLEELYPLLVSGGKIEIATDFEDYFHAMKHAVGRAQIGWSRLKMTVNERIFCPDMKTNYEIKYEASGKPLYYLELMKL